MRRPLCVPTPAGSSDLSETSAEEPRYAEGDAVRENRNTRCPDKTPAVPECTDPMPLRVGIPGDFIPFALREGNDRNGRLVGHDAELVELLADRAGFSDRLVLCPSTWKTLFSDLVSGRVDLVCGGVSGTPERYRAAVALPRYAPFWKTGLVRRENFERFAGLEVEAFDRETLRVIKNPGGTNETWVDANLKHARVRLHPVNEEIPGLIAAGEGDLMITDVTEARWYAARDARLAVLPQHFTPVEYKAFFVRRDFAGTRSLERAWESLAEDGTLAKLAHRWGIDA